MENRLIYNPLGIFLTLLFAFLLFIVVGILSLNLARTAFTKIGFSWGQALFVLLGSLLFSSVNIPLTNLKCSTPMVQERRVRAFGIAYRVPFVEDINCNTLLAINVGGAIIPILISISLLSSFPDSLLYAIGGIALVAILTNRAAKPIKGLGIATPALLPPLSAALSAIIMVYLLGAPHDLIFLIAYVSGTLGTLIGADILNLRMISNLGTPVASIGGAGTFDGVFLSGLIAVMLV